MTKEHQVFTLQEHIPALKNPDLDLAVANQADLSIQTFSRKMKVQEPNRQPPTLCRLIASCVERVFLSEETNCRQLMGVNT